jgi:co-chaperonin GroES (HSP10)
MKLQAVYNAIIVKPFDEEETKYGNIIVPDLGKERNLSGTIVSVGPGSYSATGEMMPTMLEVGQKVILPQMGPVKVEDDGIEYYVCPEHQVLAIIND